MDYVGLIECLDLDLWALLMALIITIGLLLYNKPGRRVKPPLIPIRGIDRSSQPHITLCRPRGARLPEPKSRLFRGLPPELDEYIPTSSEAHASIADFEKAMVFYRLALRASKQTVTPQPKAKAKAKAKRAKSRKVKAA